MHKRRQCSNIFDTRANFWPYWPHKGLTISSCICFLQRYVQCHLWPCAISTEWRLKHFLNISGTIPFQYLKKSIHSLLFYSVPIWKPFYFSKMRWIDRGKFRQKWIHLLWALWSLSFINFSLKEENMRNIHNQNVDELAH